MIEGKEATEVEEAARDLANFVSETGRSVRVFGAIPPVRKIMHTTVNEDDTIQNQSSGFGMFRHLVFNAAQPENTTEPAETTESVEAIEESVEAIETSEAAE